MPIIPPLKIKGRIQGNSGLNDPNRNWIIVQIIVSILVTYSFGSEHKKVNRGTTDDAVQKMQLIAAIGLKHRHQKYGFKFQVCAMEIFRNYKNKDLMRKYTKRANWKFWGSKNLEVLPLQKMDTLLCKLIQQRILHA